ncbi:non-ribosomal peptide synthetase, partial [Moorena sp. SIO2C4]|uniref:non-ribosomal peptide synthetase n=1 Tax=Moorena sp. SIO2C4 TaxID=2607824 RepID=UPI0013CA4FE1
MNLVEFLQDLALKGVKLWIDDGKLRSGGSQRVLTTEIVNQLKQYKPDILQLLQEQPDILKVHPLSYGQNGLWFLWQLAPHSYAYNVSFAIRIYAEVDLSVWQQAFQVLRERHSSLRSTFPLRAQHPIQQIHQDQPLDLLQINASTWDEDELRARVVAAHRYPFNLETGPVMRVRWFTCSNQDHVLLLTIHHIALDGSSSNLIIQELSAIYQGLQAGIEVSLPSLTHTYQDYVRWQRELVAGEEGERLCNYWQQKLAGELPVLNLPTDRLRPPIQTTNGATYLFQLSEQLTRDIKALAKSEGVTLYMILLATFQVLLYRYTEQEDILVGSPTSGRTRSEFDSIVGHFVDVMVMRSDMSGNPDFRALLAQVRQTVIGALAHQDYPFALLVERLQPIRDPSRSPIFQVSFVLQNFLQAQETQKLYLNETNTLTHWGGMEVETFAIDLFEGQDDLLLELIEVNSQLSGSFKYNTDLFDETTIARMAGHYQNLLVAIASNPAQPISQLFMMSDAEQQQVLVEWNQTTTDYPVDQCIHQLFEAQVEQTPDAIAVVFEDHQITYAQLNTRANQLAHYLQHHQDVGPKSLVGICVERSLEMVVGLLAILKAGGSYVPLDPNYPQARLDYMIQDAQLSVLLTQQQWHPRLLDTQAQVICIDTLPSLALERVENSSAPLTTDHQAYLMYTSGSTGQPKGVRVTHRGVVRLVKNTNYIDLSVKDIILQLAPISFDAATFEIWGSLLNGSQLVVMPPHQPSLAELGSAIRQHRITTLWLTAGLFHLMVEEHLEDLRPLKYLLAGGDVLSTFHVQKVLDNLKGCQLINGYGPTENTTFTCCFPVTKTADLSKSVPIGKAIANTQVYILDRHLNPVPIGIPGELHIGGDGLATGYHNRPELTQEKFIPNPFSQEPDARLYKTGDIARYLPNGNIEFLGRIDHQVKIRGFRIETGEIEATLTQNPAIKDAVVTLNKKQPGEKQLVAYLVPKQPLGSCPQTSLVADIRQLLKQQLPDYMIPGAFVLLEELPLTPNGKVDRQALPASEIDSARSQEYVPPQTPTQEIMASLFAEVLDIAQVGIHDNFFELGGHSLLATQLSSRLRQALKQDVPLITLFECPTIAQLEQALAQVPQVEDLPVPAPDDPLPTIDPNPDQRYQPFPLTEIQQAYWLGRNSTFDLGNISTHGYLELDCGFLDIDRLSQAWQRVIEHHDMLRMVILPNGEQQVLEQVPPYQIEVLDLRGQPEQIVSTELEALRHRLSHEMFPADEWPLFKIRATRLADQRYRLHWSFDALIADAWSMSIFWQQWLKLYQNLEDPLPELELSFRDYVFAELCLKDTFQHQRSQQYWWNRLETLPPTPELPLNQQIATLDQPEFSCFQAELSASDWQQLKAKAKQANLTPSGVLLAAFADLLAYWSKSPKFTINLTLFNRLPLHPQVNELVGDFTSLTLLEVNCTDAVPFAQRAQNLQGQLWQDLDHRYVGGVEVQRELRRQRGSYQPLGVVFTSMLALDTLAEKGLSSEQQDFFPLEQLGEVVYMVSQTPQVWLDHSVVEQNGALLLIWNVVADLFPEGFLNNMFSTYCHWLQQLATCEVAWAHTCPQLLPPYQQTQRIEVNATQAPISEDTLHGLFIQQAQQRPEAIALITPQRTLTYQDLYTEAQALGQQVQQLGATPNTLVAVLMEKGWEQIVAVLGILMAGAAYLPIDAALPQERQWSLLEQGEVKLVVTQAALNASLGLPDHLHCLVVAPQPQEIIDTPLEANVSSSDLAYVIFTSGSTGTPKGVMIDHRGAVNTIQDINQRFDVQPTDRMLAVSALNFDLSVYDIFGLLAAGGTLVMPTPEAAKDPVHWVELMTTHQVTLWNTVPALMQMLVEYLSEHPDQVTEDLRLALLSGDWIPLNLPTQIQSLWPQGQVVSLGGATEASIWSVYYPITTVEPEWKSIPYGKPLVNQSLHVLNHNLDPCPNWVPGQLYIGGIGLAQGYWRDEQKTNASFILHPQTGERLYKTGDLARYLPDGNSEFLGREDFQVKISGYRIELGEIEATLLGHATVKETVVAAVGELQSKQLVTYVVFHSESSDSATEDVHN